jgi:LCP family protein required for cell wall assembly
MASRSGTGGPPPSGRPAQVPSDPEDGWGADVVDGSWGPTVAHHLRDDTTARPARRVLRVIGVVAAVLVAIAVLAPVWVALRLPRTPVEGLAEAGRPLHVLITGSDSREDLTAEERAALSTGSASGQRADTILVLTVSGTRAAMLALPRDLLVERCDGSVGRINAAIGIGGPSCLVTTVRQLTGLQIAHHVEVTFGGFRDVVDAVGGVELCLDAPIADRSAGIDLPAGCQVLDGADALGFVRVRKIDDDLQRIKRQQRFVEALARELVDPTLVLRPWRLYAIAGDLGRAVTVDDDLGPVALLRLALGMRALAAGGVPAATVPADPGTTEVGAFVLRPREVEAERLYAVFRDGSVLRGALGSEDDSDPEDAS